MELPGFRLHALKGRLKGHYAVSVSGNWRVTFRFEDGEAVDVDYVVYPALTQAGAIHAVPSGAANAGASRRDGDGFSNNRLAVGVLAGQLPVGFNH